ncbi:MAG: TauD/TfdA family dioxygenase [Pigmentiphaga sp.]|uniref:TauD/TfdA family dioxygenase n=1 Tax=Pigmentiphaga sp. TaxID=1977564 RepID=UPI0029A53EEB|nr:TauD/TfdA family dioxygenase [Pigmentiphaga sp.]MDX3905926.1 TauD/TfdA family dioxygenase [Pigmentiphaga sp.]
MTSICRTPIDHPSAWTSRDLGGRGAITRPLRQNELDDIDRLLEQTAHLAPQAVTRGDVRQPALVGLLDELRADIMHGRGVVLVTGLDPSRYDPEQLERIYWAVGTHLGEAAVQSHAGDRLGRVEQDDKDPVARGYRSSGELVMHTDSYEVVGLQCIRQAARGGQSALVSSLAIHNALLRERPDLLEPLYEGYYLAIPEARLSSKPVTDEKIPVFCHVDGQVSCMYAASFMREAARRNNTALPDKLSEALEAFSAIAQRDELALRFMLAPGEILLWHNFTNLHSRTEFENDDQHRRLLLRLWLTVPDGRPVVPEFYARGQAYARVYREHQSTGAA